MADQECTNPITSVVIVADKNRCPHGFSAITKTFDDQSDADLWRESAFVFFNRPVRYLAITRETPQNVVGTHVVTDLCIVKDSDPIPMGFIAIDYTADSREKSLRKRYLCVRTVAREAVVDAVGDIVLLNKLKKPPKNYSSAGEVDGILICFKHIIIPSSFGIGLPHSRSSTSGLYPSMGETFRHSDPTFDKPIENAIKSTNMLTIKSSSKKGVEDLPFKLSPIVQGSMIKNQMQTLPELRKCDRKQLDDDYNYQFTLERAMLSNAL